MEVKEYDCPHCGGKIVIIEMNCKIFRHGIFKTNGRQIPPHAAKEDCDKWFEKGDIWGCGKPFKIIDNKAVKCEYE